MEQNESMKNIRSGKQ